MTYKLDMSFFILYYSGESGLGFAGCERGLAIVCKAGTQAE